MNGPAAYSIVSDLFPREKMPRAIAVLQIGSVLGPAITTLISFFVLKAFLEIAPIHVAFGVIHGWQLIFIIVGLPGVFISLLMLGTMREPLRHTIPDQVSGVTETPRTLGGAIVSVFRDYGQALAYIGKNWKVFAPMFGSLFVGSLGQGALAFMPMFYGRQFGWAPAKLAGLNIFPSFVLMPLGLFLGVLMAEHFARKGKGRRGAADDDHRPADRPARMFAVMMPNPWLVWGCRHAHPVQPGPGRAGPERRLPDRHPHRAARQDDGAVPVHLQRGGRRLRPGDHRHPLHLFRRPRAICAWPSSCRRRSSARSRSSSPGWA